MDPNVHKKKKRRGRVTPADLQTFVDNTAMEMEDTGTDEDKTRDFNRKSLSRLSAFKDAIDSVKPQANFIQAVTNAKTSGSKWRKYATSRRLHKEETSGAEDGRRNKTCGLGLAEIHENFLLNNKVSVVDGKIPSKLGAENNRALIHYFADLGRKSDETVTVNLDFIESLLEGGAQVNCTDKHGQTVLHEVARAWHSDVAKFLIENGADVNQPDKYGRTPLHVAAAVDYPEMVNVLIEKHADREALTFEENQTPVHYAAKNDACMSLKALVKQGCQYKMVRDYKGRTPIHVAAELDRSETARFLLELGAPVGVSDNSGQKAITLMITKMAPVARDALDQFHKKYRAERRQYFYLNLLVQENKNGSEAQSPMQVAVSHRQHELLTHKVLLRLLKVQWKHFAWIRALYAMAFNLVFILLWTLIGVVVDYDKKHLYVFPEAAWRVVLIIVAGLLTVWQIGDEINEFRKSRKSHNLWRDWRLREIERDLKFAHPQWPEEGNFLKREEENLDNSVPKYFSDWWNIFDWVCYVLLLTSLITHVVDVASHTEAIARWHNRIMSFTIILLWLRLMKFARAFEPLGPFIVILAHMFGDVLRFAFLYLEFYIPFVCAFWMLFGGTKRKEDAPIGSTDDKIVVGRFQKINEVFFTLFRLTLVDEYDYDNMKLVDSVMADILLGAWFAVSAILCLNLFIALLSDTFQRVYDNAQANAVMQKAITVLSIWENLSSKRKRAFLERCAKPLMDDYDDDVTISGDEDLKKVTIQIKDQLDELEEKWDKQRVRGDTTVSSNRGSITGGTLDADIISLREGLNQVRDSQYELEETFKREMNSIKTLMLQLSAGHSGGGHSGSHSGGSHSGSHSAVGHQPSGPPAVDYADTRARSESPTGRYSRAIVPLLQSVHSQSEDRETGQTEKPRRKMKKKRSKPLLDVGGPTPPQVMGGPVSPQVMGEPASPQVMGEPASPQVLPVMYTQQAYTGGVTSYVPATLMELTSVTPLPPPRRRQQLHPTSDIRVRRDSGAGDGPHPDPTSEC